jgi:hypothetical protein
LCFISYGAQLLAKVFPELNLQILLNTKKSIGAVAKFLDSLPHIFFANNLLD